VIPKHLGIYGKSFVVTGLYLFLVLLHLVLDKPNRLRYSDDMEYLHETEINTLLRVAYEHNREHHLALLLMYATGTRVSQALKMRGIDVFPDPITREYSVRLPKAKRGHSRSYKVVVSADPIRDLTPLIELAKSRSTSKLFGGLTRSYLINTFKPLLD